MKFLFVLGARSEWGFIKPVISLAEKRGHQCEIWACNTSVLRRYGRVVDSVKEDGFRVVYENFSYVDGEENISIVKSVGLTILSAADFLRNSKYDWVIVSGDRFEQLAFTIASAMLYIPTGHIQAGERSGNIDGVSRHAMARFAHLHFASNLDAVERLIRSGEDRDRVVLSGAPQLDEIDLNLLPKIDELVVRKIAPNNDFVLAVFHGVTELDVPTNLVNLEVMCQALKEFGLPVVWIGPNNDKGGFEIKNVIARNLNVHDKFHKNLNREDYFALLKNCQFIIGNSSSGIIESATFRVPAINIGSRQDKRVSPENVINCEFSLPEIAKSIAIATSKEFKNLASRVINPYGDGNASIRILESLEGAPVNQKWLTKQVTF